MTSFCLLGIDFDTSLKNIIKINYEKTLTQIEKQVLHHAKLGLSFWEINVIKNCLLVYFLTVLTSPGESFFLQLDTLFKNFIWGGSTKINGKKIF